MTPTLTFEGRRVHDAQSVVTLVALNEIQCMLDLHCLRRRAIAVGVPRTEAERHLKEYGHKLALGCCRRGEDGAAGGELAHDVDERSAA